MKLSEVNNPVAFFCAEFAIDNDLPTYAGGLGILSGDILNTAASQHFPMVGIGLLYKGKQFLQRITSKGEEEQKDSEFDHDTSFLRQTTIDGKPLIINLQSENNPVSVKSYHIRFSDNTILFFLSTDVDGNPPEWISDMDALYHGDTDSQIRQQILLGIGGIKLLKALNITPSIYHINEGRPCFIIWEIAKQIMDEEKCNYEEAWKKAKSKIVYTNHTLITAGNLTYPSDSVRKWANNFSKDYGIECDMLIKDGLINPQTFSITFFALNISNKHSAVSKIHGEYAKKEWPNYEWIPITNGINLLRWQDSDYRNKNLSDQDIWNQHMLKKKELVETVIERTGIGYDPERLVISWARRLAEYKQPKIIFQDIQRLKKILSNPQMPVQLLFAGNSHSADPNAKGIIEEIIKLFSNELSGYAIFIPNYNISLANHLLSGSDVWLNTPKGNLEACGTSGMKAISNGVLNCTVLDGWTYEVDWKGIGWILDPDNISSSFYKQMESEIVPLYYSRNKNGVPDKWIEKMKKSIEISENFTCEKMFENYKKLLYPI
ncbi:hypothetical protein A2Z67_01685 [Candidatus Woesebacteria bacterium RBG_13_36_22]|uniref:Alpha-glucan phosphorylase n=1 Tax=Candidatus Woesebacteria bacterium RBG_13_36_22 TaxID=1802478 RepID=A0A1F7X4X4_9BACT|nr:MAG: hypothetical protein A2Z67_01685 [Candidatus Woesebacteria bacterium RBG_13_36_22]